MRHLLFIILLLIALIGALFIFRRRRRIDFTFWADLEDDEQAEISVNDLIWRSDDGP